MSIHVKLLGPVGEQVLNLKAHFNTNIEYLLVLDCSVQCLSLFYCLLLQPKLPPDVGAEFCFLFFSFINANILINILLMENIYLKCDTVQ